MPSVYRPRIQAKTVMNVIQKMGKLSSGGNVSNRRLGTMIEKHNNPLVRKLSYNKHGTVSMHEAKKIYKAAAQMYQETKGVKMNQQFLRKTGISPESLEGKPSEISIKKIYEYGAESEAPAVTPQQSAEQKRLEFRAKKAKEGIRALNVRSAVDARRLEELKAKGIQGASTSASDFQRKAGDKKSAPVKKSFSAAPMRTPMVGGTIPQVGTGHQKADTPAIQLSANHPQGEDVGIQDEALNDQQHEATTGEPDDATQKTDKKEEENEDEKNKGEHVIEMDI